MTTSEIISLVSVVFGIIMGIVAYKRNDKNDIKEDVSVVAIMKNNLEHLTSDIKEIKDGVREINKKLNFNSEEIGKLKEQMKTLFENQKDLKSRVKDLENGRNNEKFK